MFQVCIVNIFYIFNFTSKRLLRSSTSVLGILCIAVKDDHLSSFKPAQALSRTALSPARCYSRSPNSSWSNIKCYSLIKIRRRKENSVEAGGRLALTRVTNSESSPCAVSLSWASPVWQVSAFTEQVSFYFSCSLPLALKKPQKTPKPQVPIWLEDNRKTSWITHSR